MVVITTQKSEKEIFNALENYNVKKVAIVSCGTCAALCQTGGTEGLERWTEKLEKEGIQVLEGIVSDDVCDNTVMLKDLRKIDDAVKDADAIFTLSCGLGHQSLVKVLERKYSGKPVVIANNTEFMGMTERIGRFYMRCKGCGDCLLNQTGGICPITTCAKGLMNGPCGGMVEGMCEVGDYEKECGWVMIFNRLKSMGRLDLYEKLRDSFDWSERGHQREVVFR